MEYMFHHMQKQDRPRDEDRKIINAIIIYVLSTRCRCDDMPKKYGDDSTANRRLNKWQQKGVWKKILKCAINSAYYLIRLIYKKIYQLTPHLLQLKKGKSIGHDGFKKITCSNSCCSETKWYL